MDSSASAKVEMEATRLQPLSSTAPAEPVVPMADANGSPNLGNKLKGGDHHIQNAWSDYMKEDPEVGNCTRLSGALSTSWLCKPAPEGIDPEVQETRKSLKIELTFLPICLKFAEVRYSVVKKGITASTRKEILKGITGTASPGEILALMGPSGSGKSTLLGLLGGRITGTIIQGSITYNDEPYTESLKRRIGFVRQDDLLHAHLTVKETLAYAALLRLPKTTNRQQKEERTMDVIYDLGLERCQDTIIGGAFVRGVSGGERKRVCIGIEIIINPSILFLDEPTSGLDSTTALRTMKVLQDLAKVGKTVVTSIHQPSTRLFHKFDKLILLGKGSLLYYGKASKAMDYFSSIGCFPLIAMNPAEFLLDLSNGNLSDVATPSELKAKGQPGNSGRNTRNGKPSPEDVQEYLMESYRIHAADKQKKNLEASIPVHEALKVTFSSPRRDWGASWWQQYCILFHRGLKQKRHDYLNRIKIAQIIVMAVIVSLLWWHSRETTLTEDQAGLLFYISVFWSFIPIFTAVFTFPQDRAIVNKERSVDMYNLSAYFMATITSEMLLLLILPSIFVSIVYFTTGLKNTIEHFLLTMLIVYLGTIAAQGLGLALGALVNDTKKATTIGSVVTMTSMLAGGFFVQQVSAVISWIRYVSVNHHTYRLLLKVQYGHFPPTLNATDPGNGVKEVAALLSMVCGYRLWAYISLRRTKPSN